MCYLAVGKLNTKIVVVFLVNWNLRERFLDEIHKAKFIGVGKLKFTRRQTIFIHLREMFLEICVARKNAFTGKLEFVPQVNRNLCATGKNRIFVGKLKFLRRRRNFLRYFVGKLKFMRRRRKNVDVFCR